jgi:HK97 family phage portal protein
MGFWSRVGTALGVTRAAADINNDALFTNIGFSAPSVTGIPITQQTALQATTVMACVRIVSEDISKMPPGLFGRRADGGRVRIEDHWLADLLWKPNDWQTWPEFCRQMVIAFMLRGNAFAVMTRNMRNQVTALVPINPDRVVLWQSPDGSLFWAVTRSGLHEVAVLKDFQWLIPYEDVFHLKDVSSDGLVGTSPIMLAREAIGLSLGQEHQYARLMGNGARPSGILTTDQKLDKTSAERLKADWKELHGGLQNNGKTAVLDAGLKWQPLTLTAVDMQFLQLRQFQVIEICRMFRVPPHMVGDSSQRLMGGALIQMAQDYRNNTLTSHSDIWERRLDFTFGLRKQGMFVDFDESTLLKADLTARYASYRVGRLSGWLTTNEIRIAEGLDPVDGGDTLMQPLNMGPVDGSDMTGQAPDGAGQPSDTVDGEVQQD